MVLLAKLEELNKGPTRSLDCFEILAEIYKGSHSTVFKARDKTAGEIVALKNIFLDPGKQIPEIYFREMKILKELDHRNVIKLKEIVTSVREGNKFDGEIYLVFEHMDHDLTGLFVSYGFTIPQIKCFMKQLLDGLDYCHTHNVIHRDIKGINLLVNNEGTLKIADFGLARALPSDPNEPLTNEVVTLWYRPPELLLGSEHYGPSVDMWSVGCVFAELFNTRPILTGKTEPNQIEKIFELCGSPDETNWPDVSKLPGYKNLKLPSSPTARCVRERFKNFASDALDLLDNLLTLDPSKRLTASEALKQDYFSNEPQACDPESLPKYESSYLYQKIKTRLEAAKKQKQEALISGASSQHGPSNAEAQVDEPQEQNMPARASHRDASLE